MTKHTTEKFPYDAICGDCARERGGAWPEGHAATFYTVICPYCGRTKPVCDIGDFDWPDRKLRGMRD